jgi:hypothetical protein
VIHELVIQGLDLRTKFSSNWASVNDWCGYLLFSFTVARFQDDQPVSSRRPRSFQRVICSDHKVMCREGDDLHWNDSDRRDEVKGQCSYWRTKRVGDLEGEITSIDK